MLINKFENKILKFNFNNQTPIHYRKNKEKQGKWHLIRFSIFILFFAFLFIFISWLFYINDQNQGDNFLFFSNVALSIGGGLLAGFILYILNNLRQVNIYNVRKQSPIIKKIKEIFSYIFSLIIFLNNESQLKVFFRFESYILPKNITKEKAILELKKCIYEIENIKLNECSILKKYEPQIYCELQNFIDQKNYRKLKDLTDDIFLTKFNEIKNELKNIDNLLQNDLADILFYSENIEKEIL